MPPIDCNVTLPAVDVIFAASLIDAPLLPLRFCANKVTLPLVLIGLVTLIPVELPYEVDVPVIVTLPAVAPVIAPPILTPYSGVVAPTFEELPVIDNEVPLLKLIGAKILTPPCPPPPEVVLDPLIVNEPDCTFVVP